MLTCRHLLRLCSVLAAVVLSMLIQASAATVERMFTSVTSAGLFRTAFKTLSKIIVIAIATPSDLLKLT